MRRSRLTYIAVAVCLGCFSLCGCQESKTPDFSGYKRIAELATLECTFHNVAEVKNNGKDMLFGINVGYKKAWFEYDGTLNLGVDVSRVAIEGPDADNVVTISLPPVQVLGLPDANEDSFSDIYQDTGLLTSITAVDKSEAYQLAQATMKESAEEDEVLMEQARKRAELLLGQYVRNIGTKLGQNYEVKFVDAE